MSLRVSVITCTLNSAAYLRQSIASVLLQDYPHVEYIFVDGGSNDGTLDIIREVARPITLVADDRRGISAAMNRGIAAATGDVIAHLHSDDYYTHSRVLSRVAAVFEDGKVQWCFGRALNDVGGVLSLETWPVPRYSYARLLKGNFIPHPATFVRRHVFAECGMFNTHYRYAMDYDLWLRVGKRYQPVQLDDHLAAFRRHSGSLSTANETAGLREAFRVRLANIRWTPWGLTYHGMILMVREARRRLRSRRAS